MRVIQFSIEMQRMNKRVFRLSRLKVLHLALLGLDTYYSAFLHDGIGYDLAAKGISEDEFISLLSEKIQ